MFGMTGSKAELLSIPATYATAFGFIFSYGRLMLAMSESRLLPRILRVKWGNAASASTSASTIVGSIIGYMVCIFVYFFPAVEKHLFNICILSAFGAYLSQFVGFINLRTRLADLPRLYHSPLGLCGAYYGIAVFSLAAISVVVFQKDGHMAFITVFSIAVLTSAHYFCTAKHHQKFSKDELKTLFNAHVFKCKYLLSVIMSHLVSFLFLIPTQLFLT
jgi:ethanolamine permease